MTTETGKHAKAQSAHSGIFGNRDLIKDISFQRSVSATIRNNLRPHNTPENAYLMAIHTHWACVINRKQFVYSGRFVSNKSSPNTLFLSLFHHYISMFVCVPLDINNVTSIPPECTLKYSQHMLRVHI